MGIFFLGGVIIFGDNNGQPYPTTSIIITADPQSTAQFFLQNQPQMPNFAQILRKKMVKHITTYLSLGSNIPDRADNIRRAIEEIGKHVGNITKQSPIYQTESWGYSDDDYLNKAIAVETALTPSQLLKTINDIEASLGRVRSGNGYEARTIDIDILFYNDETIDTPSLTIPHPHIALRRFVLLPMADIAPDFIHPTLNKTISQLLNECKDAGKVIKLRSEN